MNTSHKELPKGALALRVHPEGDYGSDWTWGCVVIPDGDIAIITLAARAPTDSERESASNLLKKLGYKYVKWERMKDNKARITRAFRL